MKFLIATAVLLGIVLAQSQANDNIKINNSGNEGGRVSQNVNINNQDNIATINNLNGLDSWDSICDYGAGFAATRLLHKQACVITKINKDSFPSLAHLSAVAKDKKQSTNTELRTYTVNPRRVYNFGVFGRHVESMCKGLPSYTAQEMPEFQRGFGSCCSSSIITILGFNFCF
ncbi:gastrokine-1 isoform X1 [Xenopus tropicalis]|uniref:Gastrokine-1 isoform X1 n=1 Tax=Xenopus tropicalis TaxID=8364 RepID=A0A8J1JBH7_XENTR|nr:gastrokine-1 isoform X1 [Xenopus tropicalis]